MRKSPEHRVFLFPTSRQYPVDEVCEQIIRALHARNFEVPGLKVCIKQPSWENVAYVTGIVGPNFGIQFEQRGFVAGIDVTKIHIPGQELSLSEVERYIFLHLCDDHATSASDRSNQGRKGLCVYRGSENATYVRLHEPTRPVYLVATDDSRWIERGFPSHFLTRDVLTRFSRWLKDNVLARIESGTAFTADSPAESQPEIQRLSDELRRRLETTEFCS